MKFDDILIQVGEFGPYQKRMFYLISLPMLLSGTQIFSSIFVYDIPTHRCALPGYPNDTYAIQSEAHARLVNETIPPPGEFEDGTYSGCQIYQTSTNDTGGWANHSYHDVNNTNSRTTDECDRWVYDRTYFKTTIITEFSLICGGEIMRSLSNMVSFIGSFAGSLVIGVLADLFGRKKALMLAILLQLITSLTITFAESVYVIAGARLFNGLAVHALFFIPATTGLELVGPKKRSFVGAVGELYWVVGVLLCLPIAYVIRKWRDIQLAIALLTVPLLSLWWLVPESPRWLLDKKRYDEVEVTLQKICKSNHTQLPDGAITPDTNEQEGPPTRIWSMFTHKVLLVRSFIIFSNWLAVNVLFYGLSLNTSNLEGSPYINYLLSALVEAAGYSFCLFFMHKAGRRKFHSVFMLMGGVACLSVIPAIMLDGDAWISTALSMVGKFSSSCAYTTLYVMSSELFPTVVRNSAIGVCSIFESLGGMFAPYIADLGILVPGPMGRGLPMIIFGVISLIAGGFTLLLPETLNKKLPETVEDAINFGRRTATNEPTKAKGYELVSTANPYKKDDYE